MANMDGRKLKGQVEGYNPEASQATGKREAFKSGPTAVKAQKKLTFTKKSKAINKIKAKM